MLKLLLQNKTYLHVQHVPTNPVSFYVLFDTQNLHTKKWHTCEMNYCSKMTVGTWKEKQKVLSGVNNTQMCCVCEEMIQTCLAGLGVDITLTEELLDHSHVVLLLHSRESSQHDGRVARLVLLIHTAHTCGERMFLLSWFPPGCIL